MSDNNNMYDVLIIGGGVSGTALLYTLSKYTNIEKVGLIEKYSNFGTVNSAAEMNSQTLHFGDIETNYSIEKARSVKKFADMVKNYLEAEKKRNPDFVMFSKYNKMVLAVGSKQVETLKERSGPFCELFPKLRVIEKEEIGRLEPRILEGRDPDQELLALCTEDGYTVDFGALACNFVDNAKKENPNIDVKLNTKLSKIIKTDFGYKVFTNIGELDSKTVIVTAGGHSLKIAKSLGHGKHLSILSMAGNFYTGPKVLNGKVYTMQIAKLPFAAIHGDPEVYDANVTRFGPTSKTIFFLERYNNKTFWEYWKTFGFGFRPILSFINILADWVVFKYIVRNFFYDMPLIGKPGFMKQIRKIVPNVNAKEIKFAKKVGGTRPQIVNNKTKKLELGEAKLMDKNIIFNITPSPGASTCLGNAMIDTGHIMEFLENKYTFNKEQFLNDLEDKPMVRDTIKEEAIH